MPEPLLGEVFKIEIHEVEQAFSEGEHEEGVPEMLREAEDINDEPPSTLAMAKASPSLWAGHCVPVSVTFLRKPNHVLMLTNTFSCVLL